MRAFNTSVMTGGIVVAAMALCSAVRYHERAMGHAMPPVSGASQSYLTALIAHDQGAVRVASQVRYGSRSIPSAELTMRMTPSIFMARCRLTKRT
jgi:uncharacterized protein (DUF305 family)